MPSTLSASCPCCKITADGDIRKIDEVFGFRNMSNGKQIAQSYCRKCRGKHCSPSDPKCN